jgi:hypothetical protein
VWCCGLGSSSPLLEEGRISDEVDVASGSSRAAVGLGRSGAWVGVLCFLQRPDAGGRHERTRVSSKPHWAADQIHTWAALGSRWIQFRFPHLADNVIGIWADQGPSRQSQSRESLREALSGEMGVKGQGGREGERRAGEAQGSCSGKQQTGLDWAWTGCSGPVADLCSDSGSGRSNFCAVCWNTARDSGAQDEPECSHWSHLLRMASKGSTALDCTATAKKNLVWDYRMSSFNALTQPSCPSRVQCKWLPTYFQ